MQEEEALANGNLVYQLVKVVVDGPAERMGQWEETRYYYVQEDPATEPFFMLFQVKSSGTLDRKWVEEYLSKPHHGHPRDHDAALYWEKGPPAMVDLAMKKAFRVLGECRPNPPPTPIWFHDIIDESA